MTTRERSEPGWPLYLICLLMIGALWKSGTGLYGIARSFSSGDWAAATSPQSPVYHPLWRPLLLLELSMDIVFLLGVPALLYLFTQRSRYFPIGVCLFFVINAIVQAVEVFLFPDLASTGRFAKGAGQSALIAAIVELLLIGVYLLFSARVSAVFNAVPVKPPNEA